VKTLELLVSDPYAYIDVFLLIFIRILSLFLAVPMFSNRTIPRLVKVGLAFFISLILINVVDLEISVSSSDLMNYALVLVKEFITGWLIGFSAYLAYTTLVLAGQFVDSQIGFSMVNVFDPLSQIQISITGNLYYYLVLLLTIASNAHYFFIRAIINSYDFVPIGGLFLSPDLYNGLIGFFARFFGVALQIAAPFFFIMLLTNVVLAILARTAPQMNLFVIGFPIKILLGMLVMLITMSVFDNISEMIIDMAKDFMNSTIKGMMP
jgi:flagellar biosynthetic protein FliR